MGFQYKGFRTNNIEEKDKVFYGTVENSRDYIKFEADSLENCKEEFEKAVNRYLKECEEKGIDPYINNLQTN